MFWRPRSALNLLVHAGQLEETYRGLHSLQALEVTRDLSAQAQHPGVAGRGSRLCSGGPGQEQQQHREQPGPHGAEAASLCPVARGGRPFKQQLGGGPPRLLRFLWGPAKAIQHAHLALDTGSFQT